MLKSVVWFWALSGRSFFCELPFLVAISKAPDSFLWTRVNCSLTRPEGWCCGLFLLVCESVVDICWPPVVIWFLYILCYVSPLSSGDSLCFPMWLANSWSLFFLMGTLYQQSHSCTKKISLSCWSPFRCPSLSDKRSTAITWVTTQPILIINKATAFQSPSISVMIETTNHWGGLWWACWSHSRPDLMCNISNHGVEHRRKILGVVGALGLLESRDRTCKMKQNNTAWGYEARWPLPLQTVFSWKP